jgi:hypothetical protein
MNLRRHELALQEDRQDDTPSFAQGVLRGVWILGIWNMEYVSIKSKLILLSTGNYI